MSERTSRSRPGNDDRGTEERACIAAAESRLAELSEGYEDLVARDIERMGALLEAAWRKPAGRGSERVAMFDICHNLKGQGGTFGYDLLTRIGASLCDFLRRRDDLNDTELGVVRLHVAALDVVVQRRIKGAAKKLADSMQAKLDQAIAQAES